MKANIVFEDSRWQILPLKKIALASLNLVADNVFLNSKDLEISILASNDCELMDLNKQFRGHNVPTNILSWPEHDYKRTKPGELPKRISKSSDCINGSYFLGNLAISFDRCSTEAENRNITVEDHIAHLLIHGCLHLVGFDHDNKLDAILMENIEKKLLSDLGIKNPYELIDQ